MPPYQTFLNDERLPQLFGWAKWILFYIAPGLMIAVAFLALNLLIDVIKNIFKKDKEDHDDDYEIYKY